MFYKLLLSVFLTLATTLILQYVHNGHLDLANINSLTTIAIFASCFISAVVSPQLPSTLVSANSGSKPSSKPSGNREQGTVKWFNVSKGYGFVTRGNGEDIFVHFRSINGKGRRILREGQSVEFVVTTGDKGPQAEDVEAI